MHRISFADIEVLDDFTMEIVVDRGTEITSAMVEELHASAVSLLKPPYLFLINNKNPYCYAWEAQISIGKLDQLIGIAMVCRTRSAEISAMSLNLERNSEAESAILQNRHSALKWLNHTRDTFLSDSGFAGLKSDGAQIKAAFLS